MEAELVSEVLFGPARMLGGSRMDDDDLIKLAREEFEDRAFCVVRDWMILDLMLPEGQENEIKNQGLQSTVLYFHRVIFDSEARVSIGNGFVTGYQKDFHGCFFESKDTLYILAGRGARKHASLPAVEAIAAAIKRVEKTYG
ncbi:hypothetical protein HGO40_07275 [Pseudomonas sp. CG7]|uniref:DUF6957 family protein n=1 Tax=Pseudomonas sp. CG7 TaxID=191007 RepID=UPI002033EECA|nr:hypothetical protein [Pseudomonas sp. CG7]